LFVVLVTADSSCHQRVSNITGCLSYRCARAWPRWPDTDSLSGV